MHILKRLLFVIAITGGLTALAGNSDKNADTIHKEDVHISKPALKNFNIDGSYQAMVYCRDFSKLFDGNQTQHKLILGNGDGGEYRQLRLNFTGRPTSKTYFKTDMYLSPGMRGYGYNTTDRMGIEIGVNLEAQLNVKKSNVYLKFGGTQFTKLSKLTLWATENKGESVFERSPWGGFQESGKNYESYYSQGTISRDFTWGNKFIQGVSADITKLPWGLESKVILAKTPNNGGQTSYTAAVPNISYGANVRKYFGMNYIGINSFNAKNKNDSINGNYIGYNVITGDASFSFFKNDMTISGEAGTCRFISNNLQEDWGNAIDLTLLSRHKLVRAPITFHFFRIEPKFINLEAGFNTFLQNASANYNGEGASISAIGANMSDIDYINGNRQGGDIRGEFNIQGLKLNLATGFSKEVEHLTNVISYSHRINNIMFARVYQYQTLMGLNQSMTTTYRGYYEVSSIDTTNPSYKNDKLNFSNLECNLKYKINIFDKPLYLFYLTTYSSTQDKLTVIPIFSDKAYMRVQYHETEAYYNIRKGLSLTSYFGVERMQGNQTTFLGTATSTTVDTQTGKVVSQKGNPTNVIGQGIGLGLDYDLSDVANLYMRCRFFDYKDRNNAYYRYKGIEATVELRIYF